MIKSWAITGRFSVPDHHIKQNVTGFRAIFSLTDTWITWLESSALNSTITAVYGVYWLVRSTVKGDASCSLTQCNCTKGINLLRINKIFYFPLLLGQEIKENCPQLTSMPLTTYYFYCSANSVVIQQICIKGIYCLFDSVKCDYIYYMLLFPWEQKKPDSKITNRLETCVFLSWLSA